MKDFESKYYANKTMKTIGKRRAADIHDINKNAMKEINDIFDGNGIPKTTPFYEFARDLITYGMMQGEIKTKAKYNPIKEYYECKDAIEYRKGFLKDDIRIIANKLEDIDDLRSVFSRAYTCLKIQERKEAKA